MMVELFSLHAMGAGDACGKQFQSRGKVRRTMAMLEPSQADGARCVGCFEIDPTVRQLSASWSELPITAMLRLLDDFLISHYPSLVHSCLQGPASRLQVCRFEEDIASNSVNLISRMPH